MATAALTGNAASGDLSTVVPSKSVALTGDAASGAVGTTIAVYWTPISATQTPVWTVIDTEQN